MDTLIRCSTIAAASDLGLHCLPMSPKETLDLHWLNNKIVKISPNKSICEYLCKIIILIYFFFIIFFYWGVGKHIFPNEF